MVEVRTTCVRCGMMLTSRAWPHGRWGSWCPKCNGWWPDHADGRKRNVDQPPRWELVDGTERGTIVRSLEAPSGERSADIPDAP